MATGCISVGRGLCHECCICVQVRSAGTDFSFIITAKTESRAVSHFDVVALTGHDRT